MRNAGGILAILIAIIGVFAGFKKAPSGTEQQLITETTVDSALFYTLNRMSRTRWLSGVVDFSDPVLLPIYRTICPSIERQRSSHFRDRADRSIDSIADSQTNSGAKSEDCTLQSLVENASFKTWVEPERYRDDVPLPVWNGLFRIRAQARYGSATSERSCLIRAYMYPDEYTVFADKAISLFDFCDSNNEFPGPFFSNGLCLIGDRVVAGTDQQTSRIVGRTILDGQLIGNLMTSSISSLQDPIGFENSDQSRHEAVSGNLKVLRGFERIARFNPQDPFYPCDWKPIDYSTFSLESCKIFPLYGCRNGQVRSISDVVDCSSRLDCEEGFNGLWITYQLSTKHIRNATDDAPEDSNDDSGTGAPERDNEPALYRIPFPELDFEALERIAEMSPEHRENTAVGTVFSSWEEFSSYINDPSYELVSHDMSSDGSKIRVGRFSDDGHALDPLVFYINKAASDLDFPDRGCFRIDTPKSELILNGCLISETGIDLRDRTLENRPPHGRWREYSSGRDGRVVRYCGYPLKSAMDPNACSGLPAYKWVDDGAWDVTILGYPGAPALAAAGDILIVDRHTRTVIDGPVMAQRGDVLIWNERLGDDPSVICHAPILGATVQIAGSIRIAHNEGLTKLVFLKNLGFYRFNVIEWNDQSDAD